MRTKRKRINTAVIVGLSEGGITLPGDKTLEEPPERDLQEIAKEMSTFWLHLCCSLVPSGPNFHHPELQTELTCERLWEILCEASTVSRDGKPLAGFPPEPFQTGWGIASRCFCRLNTTLFGSPWNTHTLSKYLNSCWTKDISLFFFPPHVLSLTMLIGRFWSHRSTKMYFSACQWSKSHKLWNISGKPLLNLYVLLILAPLWM